MGLLTPSTHFGMEREHITVLLYGEHKFRKLKKNSRLLELTCWYGLPSTAGKFAVKSYPAPVHALAFSGTHCAGPAVK